MLEIVSQLLRQQANRGNSRGVHDIDDPGHHGEFDRRITPDKRGAVGTHLEDFTQPGIQILPRHRFLIDAQGTVGENLYHNYVGFVSCTILRPLSPARLRNLRLEPRE
jgi:hypothetical protein